MISRGCDNAASSLNTINSGTTVLTIIGRETAWRVFPAARVYKTANRLRRQRVEIIAQASRLPRANRRVSKCDLFHQDSLSLTARVGTASKISITSAPSGPAVNEYFVLGV
jgi:hypothetical protein